MYGIFICLSQYNNYFFRCFSCTWYQLNHHAFSIKYNVDDLLFVVFKTFLQSDRGGPNDLS